MVVLGLLSLPTPLQVLEMIERKQRLGQPPGCADEVYQVRVVHVLSAWLTRADNALVLGVRSRRTPRVR